MRRARNSLRTSPGVREDREVLYRRLSQVVGNTPLTQIRNIEVPGENRIFVKEEYRNPTGSHYDRVILRLLQGLESEGRIHEGDHLIDTTTGNSGAAFAWLCGVLGFGCTVVIPGDMPSARIAQIESYGAKVERSAPGRYVDGLIDRFKQLLDERRGECITTNHAANCRYPPEAMIEAGKEVVEAFARRGSGRVDCFVSAVGNGTSTHMAIPLQENFATRVIGVEPVESPTTFLLKFGEDEFVKRYGRRARSVNHGLIGTGPGEVNFPFPILRRVLDVIEDIVLVERTDWERWMRELADKEGQHVGRTSAACMSAAMTLAEQVDRKNIVLIFYDPAWKYLSP
jgi:cysteine synthase A